MPLPLKSILKTSLKSLYGLGHCGLKLLHHLFQKFSGRIHIWSLKNVSQVSMGLLLQGLGTHFQNVADEMRLALLPTCPLEGEHNGVDQSPMVIRNSQVNAL